MSFFNLGIVDDYGMEATATYEELAAPTATAYERYLVEAANYRAAERRFEQVRDKLADKLEELTFMFQSLPLDQQENANAEIHNNPERFLTRE